MGSSTLDQLKKLLLHLKNEMEKMMDDCTTVEEFVMDIEFLMSLIQKTLELFSFESSPISCDVDEAQSGCKATVPPSCEEYDEDTVDLSEDIDAVVNKLADTTTEHQGDGLQEDQTQKSNNASVKESVIQSTDFSNFSELLKHKKGHLETMIVTEPRTKSDVAGSGNGNVHLEHDADHEDEMFSDDDTDMDVDMSPKAQGILTDSPENNVVNAQQENSDENVSISDKYLDSGHIDILDKDESSTKNMNSFSRKKGGIEEGLCRSKPKMSTKSLCTFERKENLQCDKKYFYHNDPKTWEQDILECVDCLKTFDATEEKAAHVCTKIENKPLICYYCGKHFNDIFKLRVHVITFHIEYKITFEGKIETTRKNGDIVSYIRRSLRCERCNNIFQRPKDRDSHIRRRVCKLVQPHSLENNIDTKHRDDLSDGDGTIEEVVNGSGAKAIWSDIVSPSEPVGVPEVDGSYVQNQTTKMPRILVYTTVSRVNSGQSALKQEPGNSNSSEEVFLDELFIQKTSSRKKSDQIKIFRCRFCDERFSCMDSLERHERSVHTGEKPHLCEICALGFYTRTDLRNHLLEHSFPNFACKICGKELQSGRNLQRHMARHTGKYKCEVCGKTFAYTWDLKRHLKSVHSSKIRDIICELCGASYKDKSSLNFHTKSVHSTQKAKCPICFLVFKNDLRLQYHHANVHVEKKFACSECDARFTKNYYLKVHQFCHSKVTPFKCSFCPKAFTCKKYLVPHERIHTGQKPYTCNICGKKSSDSGNHYKHMKIHKK